MSNLHALTIAFVITGCTSSAGTDAGSTDAITSFDTTVTHDFPSDAPADTPAVFVESMLGQQMSKPLAPFTIELASETAAVGTTACTVSLRQSATENRLARFSTCGGLELRISRVLSAAELSARRMFVERIYWGGLAWGAIDRFEKATTPVELSDPDAYKVEWAAVRYWAWESGGTSVFLPAAQVTGFDASLYGDAWKSGMRLKGVTSFLLWAPGRPTHGKVGRQVAFVDR